MRIMALLILSFAVLTACGNQSTRVSPIIIEQNSPVIGEDGSLVQSIGIETLGGAFTPFLTHGTPVPCSVSQIFSTASENQNQITVSPFRGTAEIIADCEPLGVFHVVGIPPAPRGLPKIEITFAVQDGNIELSAKDLSTGKLMQINEMKSEHQSDRETP
jgi:molecular chaperone DnaK